MASKRDDWVAVAPEFSSSGTKKIQPAQSAYQFFQRHITPVAKEELYNNNPHQKFDVGAFSRLVRSKWNALGDEERVEFEDLAQQDMMRFRQESHMADVLKQQEQERKQAERENIVFYDDKTATRGAIRKLEKRRLKKQQKKKRKQQQLRDDNREWTSDMEQDEDDGNDSGEYNSDDSDDSSVEQKKKKPAPRKVSAKVLERREQQKREKERKEQYIESRQQDLAKDRAKQAKRRLEFLLQQSDIFSHFGTVKEESARYGITPKAPAATTKGSRRDQDDDQEQHQQQQDQDTTYLTKQPTTLGFGTMRPYQLEGLNWMIRLQENGVNGILADEMGLGKTLQSISILVYMHEFQDCTGPHLVVVPKSTLSNWMNEIKRWAPKLTAVKFHGTKEERLHITKHQMEPAQKDEDRQWNICLTTYEVCNIDKNVLNKFAWSYLVVDEAHRLKNEGSAFSKTLRTFETRYRLLLTGTPLQNNLHELWALLNFLVPDVFCSSEQFDEWFNLDIEDANEKNKLISQLHKILRPFMLRRLKADVETTLPPKHETILYTGMSAMQKKLYRDILMRDFDLLQGGSGSRTALLNIVMQLRKCAGHPYLFPNVEDRSLPPLGEHIVENCGKMVLLDKLLKRLKERGHRVLLFSQMTRLLDLFEDYCVMRQYAYCRIDGNTAHELREEYIDAYNQPNSSKFIFLLSTRAGGLGINLQTADIVILYDSDWNPQADLQAQDRAHRIGQKREVQVFRFVTEHTIEEKIVERAQQKLKLDAMIVQQSRLKDKDKQLSRDELMDAVRFGADKIFKSKDSSITDDDIDMILNAGKRKTQELNDKLKAADKGDLLDFKLDGSSISTQPFDLAMIKNQEDQKQQQGEQSEDALFGIMDIGKRERRTVANYNETKLYQQQIHANDGAKKKKKKTPKLPKHLRLPRMEDWQMYDRSALYKIQEQEEAAFKALPEEEQKLLASSFAPVTKQEEGGEEKTTEQGEQQQRNDDDKAEQESNDNDQEKPKCPPTLISKELYEEKQRLLSEGFSSWTRTHYNAFVRASSKYGRTKHESIAVDVGKPVEEVVQYAQAFWNDDLGKARFSTHEYERVVKMIERGEKKRQEVQKRQEGTKRLVAMFDNPWQELEFTHVNCRDKMFTPDEDRYLLCWAHKFGYGQWNAVKMAIRRSPNFRFDYLLKSLPVDAIGRRCEQLMKAAEKEVEQLEKKFLEANPSAATANDNNDQEDQSRPVVQLPKFKVMRAQMRRQDQEAYETKRSELVQKVQSIEEQMRQVQERLKVVNVYTRESSAASTHDVFASQPDLLGDLCNHIVKITNTSNSSSIMSIATSFLQKHREEHDMLWVRNMTKTQICAKIEEVAYRQLTKWFIRDEYKSLLEADMLELLEQQEEEEQKKNNAKDTMEGGAIGPSGEFEPFPDYDGQEPPRPKRAAFTHFCNHIRKEVKSTLSPRERKNKSVIHGLLKERWLELSETGKGEWRKREEWDSKRFDRDSALYKKNNGNNKRRSNSEDVPASPTGSKRQRTW